MVRFRARIAAKVLFGLLIFFPVLTFIVMSLWNGVLTVVLHVGVVTFWQAAGILILSKILFGFGRGPWRGHRDDRGFEWRKQMMEKWSTMTPEERLKFKQEFKNRCGGRWRGDGPFQRPEGEEAFKVD